MAAPTNDWTVLAACIEKVHVSIPISISNTEFIIVGQHALYKYHLKSNKWVKWTAYPSHISSSYHCASFDTQNNKLYIYSLVGSKNNTITITFKNTIASEETQDFEFKIWKKTKEIGTFASSIFINNQFNIIGGDQGNQHFIFDQTNGKCETIYTFNKYLTGFSGHCLIYNKYVNELLLIGGCDDTSVKALDTIYSFKLSNNTNNKWKLLQSKLPIPILDCAYVISSDGKYVLLFGGGGSSSNYAKDDIWIMDLNGKDKRIDIRKSKIVCPKKGVFNAVRVGDDVNKTSLLVFGYVRCCWNVFNREKYNIGIISNDLIKLVEQYCYHENVHLIDRGTGAHWKISLSVLLQ